MISKTMTEALNKQLQKEFYSAYLYLGMSAWCSENGYTGGANWFMVQYQEEQMHAMKVYSYLLSQNAHIKLLELRSSKTDYKDLLSCFEKSLVHEQGMTKASNNLCDLATKEKDHASYAFMQWFVNEQTEEEASLNEIIKRLTLAGDGNTLFMIDNQLAARTAKSFEGA